MEDYNKKSKIGLSLDAFEEQVNLEVEDEAKQVKNELIDIVCPNCHSTVVKISYTYHNLFFCENCYKYCQFIYNKNYDRDCCETPDKKYVKYILSNKAEAIREQCFSCGYLHGKSHARKDVPNVSNVPIYSELLVSKYYENRTELGNKIRAEYKYYHDEIRPKIIEQGHSNTKEESKKDYHEYLKSDEWREKRALVLKRDNNICQSCMVNKAQDVHHLTYKFIFNEPIFTLVSVCRPCHEAIELMKDGKECNRIAHKK